jgi:hypothetical protein
MARFRSRCAANIARQKKKTHLQVQRQEPVIEQGITFPQKSGNVLDEQHLAANQVKPRPDAIWYVIDPVTSLNVGPLTPGKLKALVAAGQITASTRVRRKDTDWMDAGTVRGLLPAPSPPAPSQAIWYWWDRDWQVSVGPLTSAKLLKAVRSGLVTRNTKVRREDTDWVQAGSVKGLMPPLPVTKVPSPQSQDLPQAKPQAPLVTVETDIPFDDRETTLFRNDQSPSVSNADEAEIISEELEDNLIPEAGERGMSDENADSMPTKPLAAEILELDDVTVSVPKDATTGSAGAKQPDASPTDP